MSGDGTPKSAVELALERLKRRDAEGGGGVRALSDGQKREIAEIRRVYEARIAEVDILRKPRRPADLPAEIGEAVDALDDEYRRERDRLAAEREARIEAVRNR